MSPPRVRATTAALAADSRRSRRRRSRSIGEAVRTRRSVSGGSRAASSSDAPDRTRLGAQFGDRAVTPARCRCRLLQSALDVETEHERAQVVGDLLALSFPVTTRARRQRVPGPRPPATVSASTSTTSICQVQLVTASCSDGVRRSTNATAVTVMPDREMRGRARVGERRRDRWPVGPFGIEFDVEVLGVGLVAGGERQAEAAASAGARTPRCRRRAAEPDGGPAPRSGPRRDAR